MTAFNNAAASFAPGGHNHQSCRDYALVAAERVCAARGLKLTAQRRRVLELIWQSHAPVGAYEILRRLSDTQDQGLPPRALAHSPARPIAPPTVYRALDFLRGQGLIHRIESLNAYVGCVHPDGAHGGQFLICGDCGAAAEFHDPRVETAILRRAEELGFAVRRKTVEIEGLCPPCQTRQEETRHAG